MLKEVTMEEFPSHPGVNAAFETPGTLGQGML